MESINKAIIEFLGTEECLRLTSMEFKGSYVEVKCYISALLKAAYNIDGGVIKTPRGNIVVKYKWIYYPFNGSFEIPYADTIHEDKTVPLRIWMNYDDSSEYAKSIFSKHGLKSPIQLYLTLIIVTVIKVSTVNFDNILDRPRS